MHLTRALQPVRCSTSSACNHSYCNDLPTVDVWPKTLQIEDCKPLYDQPVCAKFALEHNGVPEFPSVFLFAELQAFSKLVTPGG